MTVCADKPVLYRAAERVGHAHVSGKTVLQGLFALLVIAVAAATLHGRMPQPGDVAAALGGAKVGWVLLAGLAMVVSMAMFARQQRRLLAGFGVAFPRNRALALAFSRSAMAISLPAGSVVSAGYAFRQFLAGGADRRSAATVAVLSGVVSAAALALLYGSGLLVSSLVGVSTAWHAHPAVAVGACSVVVVTLGLLKRFVPRTVATRHWVLALVAATANWSADLLCLVLVAQAFAVPAGFGTLAVIYLGAQVVRQIPLTPGGIGVIEASLLAGLISAGTGEAAAAAAVLTYRLLSCWLVIPTGFACWLLLRRAGDRQIS